MSTDTRTGRTRTTHVTPALAAALMGTATAAVTLAVTIGTPAAGTVVASSMPERCGPVSSAAGPDFVDRITIRKEQLSRDRAVWSR